MRKRDAFIHAPWDGGAITGMFQDSPLMRQRTIGTRCGRRVKFEQAPADVTPTCPACIEALANDAHAYKAIAELWATVELPKSPEPDPQRDGGLPWTRADEDAALSNADYYEEKSRTGSAVNARALGDEEVAG